MAIKLFLMSWHRTGSNFLMTNLGHFDGMDLRSSHYVTEIENGYQGITIARDPLLTIASAICNTDFKNIPQESLNINHMIKQYYDFHLEILGLKHNIFITFDDLTKNTKETISQLLKNTNANMDNYYFEQNLDNIKNNYKSTSAGTQRHFEAVAELRKSELSGCYRVYNEMRRRALFVPGTVADVVTE